jgi:hypothetical protein
MGIKAKAGIRKDALIDSSSTILLFKSNLLEHTISHYNIILTESVYKELTRSALPGSQDVKQYRENGMIAVMPDSNETIPGTVEHVSVEYLGRGEHDTILLFLRGCGELIIMDDGKGANACKRNRIPYINALLVPRVLLIAGKLSADECDEFIRRIVDCGRYSEKIIDYAKSCPDDALTQFV